MNENIIELKKKFLEIKNLGWIESNQKGYGSAGEKFEELVGKKRDQERKPDFKGIEIKTKIIGSEKYIGLFSSAPNNTELEIYRIQKDYGYPDSDYPEFNVFNASIYGKKVQFKTYNYQFLLYVDYYCECVRLLVKDKIGQVIDKEIYWTFSLLKKLLFQKLSYLAVIKVNRKYKNKKVYFRYIDITFYKLLNFDKFLELIEQGVIRVTFKISVTKKVEKFGTVHDHGTTFEINDDEIEKLFFKWNEQKIFTK